MEKTSSGIVLTSSEAFDLREVCNILCGLREVFSTDLDTVPVVLPTLNETDQLKARWLEAHATQNDPDESEILIESEYYGDVKAVAELAIANSPKVVQGLCTPNFVDGYYSSWRPAAFRVMAMVAEISTIADDSLRQE